MLTFILLLIGAALLYGIGIFSLVRRHRLRLHGRQVEALVISEGQNKNGRYFVLQFSAEGKKHRLNYPVARKGNFCRMGDTVTLYYDPQKPERHFVPQDGSAKGGIAFYLLCATALLALALLAVPSLF